MSHLISLLAMAAAGVTAVSDPDVSRIQSAFGNTIISTYPDGRQAHLWLRPGGAYTALGRHGEPTSGSWRIKAGRICFKQARPHAYPFSYCTVVPNGGVGASWSARAVTGEMLRIRLVSGMPDRSA